MADLNDIAVFVRVAQFESFSRAAHALGMPVSTVSRKVTALEERLAVTLLQRTTRKLSLTAQGRAYFNQCSELLSHLFDAERHCHVGDFYLSTGDPLIGRRQENQWLGDFHDGDGPLQNPLFLANVTMPNDSLASPKRRPK
jgi:DNA-binding MarR family transcriptional regulator